jgi:O-antigen ligase
LAYCLFLAVNATLVIRPAEIVSELQGLPLFQGLILASLALSFSAVTARLRPAALAAQPITACVIGMMPFVLLSNLANLNFGDTLRCGLEFSKTVIYYLLLVTLVNTGDRLRWLLYVLVICITILVALILAQHFGVLTTFQIQSVQERYTDGNLGQEVTIARVRGTGLFGDPNELCLILVLGIMLCVYRMTAGPAGALRGLWLVPAALFAFTIALTRSRGGFLAVLGALITYFYLRFGKTRTLLLAAIVVPALLLVYGGRQTEISTGALTARQRLDLWSDALFFLRHNPVFGIGFDKFAEFDGHVVHNSFLHCFTEIGFVGGALFLGAFVYAFREINRAPLASPRLGDLDLLRLRPCLLAGLAGYVIGFQTVSYCYPMPTYLVLGIATAYLQVSANPAAGFPAKLDGRLLGRFGAASIIYLVALFVFVALFR